MNKADKINEKNHPKRNLGILKFILLAFAIWQTAILLITLISPKILPLREQFTYNDGAKLINPRFLWSRANFDGAHYLIIAKNGYGLHQQAFFPFYPNLIRFLTPLFGGKDLLAGLVISNISLIAALFFFYKIIALDYDESIARRSVIFLFLFPGSFFLTMVYTESLFLMLLLGAFYTARKGKWLLAGIFGGLASYTRIIGVFIFPALIIEWWQQSKGASLKEKMFLFFPLLLVPVGLLNYMEFLYVRYHDALMFVHVQPAFGGERSNGKLILIYQVFWRYIKMISKTQLYYTYFTVWLELLVAIGFLALLILAYIKKVRSSYLVFSIFSFVIPSLTGTFLSLPRFALTLFPCFILLGMIKNNFLRYFLQVIFGLLLVVATSFFLRGHWVS